MELGHLKIETTLIDEMFASVMGEYVFFILSVGVKVARKFVYYESLKRECERKLLGCLL